jgi:hypothetical protein
MDRSFACSWSTKVEGLPYPSGIYRKRYILRAISRRRQSSYSSAVVSDVEDPFDSQKGRGEGSNADGGAENRAKTISDCLKQKT